MEIELSKGKFATIDDCDISDVNKYSWSIKFSRGKLYSKSRIVIDKKIKYVDLHRFIMRPLANMLVDHIGGNGLNNRRSNLRICTRSENNHNCVKQKRSESIYKGLTKTKQQNKIKLKSGEIKICDKKYIYWVAKIVVGNKRIFLGSFKNEKDAAIAYNNAAIKYYGEFANINIIQ